MVRPDGTFHSIRYVEMDRRAGELFGISGAAINAYTCESFQTRNALERQLDAEWAHWQARKLFYLHNPTPWQPSKLPRH